MFVFVIIAVVLLLIFLAPKAHAANAQTYPDYGPMPQQLQDLLNQYYNLNNTVLNGYTAPINGTTTTTTTGGGAGTGSASTGGSRTAPTGSGTGSDIINRIPENNNSGGGTPTLDTGSGGIAGTPWASLTAEQLANYENPRSSIQYNPDDYTYYDQARKGAFGNSQSGNVQQGYDMSDYAKYALTDQQYKNNEVGWSVDDNGYRVGGSAPAGYTLDPITGKYYPDWAFAQAEGTGGSRTAPTTTTTQTAPMNTINGVPQPYDNNTMMGQLLNGAVRQQYTANDEYNNLVGQSSGIMDNQLGALENSKTAGDWYFNNAQGMYGRASDYLTGAETAGDQFYGQAASDLGSASSYLSQAAGAGQPFYDIALNAYGKAPGLIDQQADTLNIGREGAQWYDDFTRGQLQSADNLLTTGVIPKEMEDAFMGTINRGLQSSLGTTMNDLAGRGVVNSSVSNKALNNLGKIAADEYQNAYLENLMSLVTGRQGNAAQGISGGGTFGKTYIDLANGFGNAAQNYTNLGAAAGNTGHQRTSDYVNIAGGYTNNANVAQSAGHNRVSDYVNMANSATGQADSLMNAGNSQVNNQLNIATGYGNAYNNNLAGREALMNDIPNYWNNALAGMMPGYDMLKTGLNTYAQTGRQTTVVDQPAPKRGCFITTAVCQHSGKPDDCFELTTLRDFRDMWLRNQPMGEALIRQYYKEAPKIAEDLTMLPNSDIVLEELRVDFLEPCLRLIKERKYEECKDKYIQMFNYAKEVTA